MRASGCAERDGGERRRVRDAAAESAGVCCGGEKLTSAVSSIVKEGAMFAEDVVSEARESRLFSRPLLRGDSRIFGKLSRRFCHRTNLMDAPHRGNVRLRDKRL